MTTQDVLHRIVAALERAGIPSMLTGSHASSYHGMPRATQDIDIVISPSPAQIRALAKDLPDSEYYVDEEAALDAVRRRTQFNVIDLETGWKIDLIIRKSRSFSLEEFERRETVTYQGMQLAVATAEDILIAKLEWAKRGSSLRQIEDAAGILRIRSHQLDQDYIEHWIGELGLEEEWNQCREVGLDQ
jgi:hypothetical protein